MTDFTFSAKKRDCKAQKTRGLGLIPAILYGKNLKNQTIALNSLDFNQLYREAGSSNLINLSIDDKDKYKVLVHQIQKNPITDQIEHVDLLKIDMKKKIKTEIPLTYVGESILVLEQEGSFISNKDSVEVECLPNDLTDHIKIDISGLVNFEQNLKVSDILVPKGIEILDNPEEVIALVQPPRSEEELEALDEEVVEDVETVEVEEKSKEDEESKEGEEKGEEKTEEDKEADAKTAEKEDTKEKKNQ